MYSKRRSPRHPDSFHTPCTPQLVFTRQNAEPHDATAASAAAQTIKAAATAAPFDVTSCPPYVSTAGARMSAGFPRAALAAAGQDCVGGGGARAPCARDARGAGTNCV